VEIQKIENGYVLVDQPSDLRYVFKTLGELVEHLKEWWRITE